jgi:ABC-type phosphonate transport system ATPase subunit
MRSPRTGLRPELGRRGGQRAGTVEPAAVIAGTATPVRMEARPRQCTARVGPGLAHEDVEGLRWSSVAQGAKLGERPLMVAGGRALGGIDGGRTRGWLGDLK